jgi:branched-chain amino acid transport system ATP-binding protein
MSDTGPLFEVRNITKHFGGLQAVSDVDFSVLPGEILGLIGPNGAGKSTIFNLISGFYPLSSGNVIFKGEDITGRKAHKIAELGISRAFQEVTLFMKLSVLENVLSGFHLHYRQAAWKSFLRTPAAKNEETQARKEVLEILEFTGLSAVKDQLAQNLPHGHQKILSVCIALATHPTLLLLDEPLTGMHPEETEEMMRVIRRIRDRGITIILVEHNIDAVMRLCDRIVVLNQGRKIAEGLPLEIRNHRDVIEAYLGTDDDGEEGA